MLRYLYRYFFNYQNFWNQAMVETMTTGCDSEEACIPQHIDLPPLGPPPQLPFPHMKAALKKPLCYLPPGTWLNLRIKKGEPISLILYLNELHMAKFYWTGLTYISSREKEIVGEAFSQCLEAGTASLCSTFFEKLSDFVTHFIAHFWTVWLFQGQLLVVISITLNLNSCILINSCKPWIYKFWIFGILRIWFGK